MAYVPENPTDDILIPDPVVHGAGEYTTFGFAIAIEGTVMVVGNPGTSGYNFNSYFSIYENLAGTWTEVFRLTDTTTNAQLGYSVAIHNGTVVVGERGWFGGGSLYSAGRVHVYTKVAGTWTQQQIITAPILRASDLFGTSVGIYDDWIVVGAEAIYGSYYNGRAYVFKRTAGVWGAGFELLGPSGYATNDSFGHAVSIYGTRLAVAAPQDTRGALAFTGAVSVFDFDGASWVKTQDLVDPAAVSYSAFGADVAVRGDTVFVTRVSIRTLYVFQLSGTWSSVAALVHPYVTPITRLSASPDGKTVFVTASDASVAGLTKAGSVICYTSDNWAASNSAYVCHEYPPVANAHYGYSVYYDGTTVGVGCIVTYGLTQTMRVFEPSWLSGSTASTAAYLMQAADSVTGALYYWTSTTPDWAAAGYPGPNAAVDVAVAGRTRETG